MTRGATSPIYESRPDVVVGCLFVLERKTDSRHQQNVKGKM